MFIKMKYIKLMVILAFVVSAGKTQDPQFPQFYSSPLYLAPSFAGATDGGRVILNYRDQWPQLLPFQWDIGIRQ